jgi:hypothetical protein
MKPVKFSLRVWIAVTSVLSFLGGWALFSHAGKPAPLFPAALDPQTTGGGAVVAATLAPIPSLNDLTASAKPSGNLQVLPSQPNVSVQQFAPRLRSRGS